MQQIYLKSYTIARMSSLLHCIEHWLLQEPPCPASVWLELSLMGRPCGKQNDHRKVVQRAQTHVDESDGYLGPSHLPQGRLTLDVQYLKSLTMGGLGTSHLSVFSRFLLQLLGTPLLDLRIQFMKPLPKLPRPETFGISRPFVLCIDLKFLFSESKLFSLFRDSWKWLRNTRHLILEGNSGSGRS